MMKATMIAVGGLSGGISSAIAGGSFWKGFQQGLITSGLNHVAHLAAATILETKLKNRIKERIVDKCGEEYLDRPVTDLTLQDLAEIFPELYNQTAKDFSIADNVNIKYFQGDGYSLNIGGEIVDKDGWAIGGLTDTLGTGKVLISPAKAAQGVLVFAKTWYHEGIHSMHAVSKFAFNIYKTFTNLKFNNADRIALDVSEMMAHAGADFMSGNSSSSFVLKKYMNGFSLWLNLINK